MVAYHVLSNRSRPTLRTSLFAVLLVASVGVAGCSADTASLDAAASTATAQPTPDYAAIIMTQEDSQAAARQIVHAVDSQGRTIGELQHAVSGIAGNTVLKFGDGYVVPTVGEVQVLDQELNLQQRIPVKSIGANAELVAADVAQGQNAATAALTFALPPEHRATTSAYLTLVLTGEEGKEVSVHSMIRKSEVEGLTACADGTLVWLEWAPLTVRDEDGAGFASLVSWTANDGVVRFPIEESFAGKPWSFNQLDCNLHHHRLLAPHARGAVSNIGVRLDTAEKEAFVVKGRRTLKGKTAELPATTLQANPELSNITGDRLTVMNDKGELTLINMYQGAEETQVHPELHQQLAKTYRMQSAHYEDSFATWVWEPREEAASGSQSHTTTLSYADLEHPDCVNQLLLRTNDHVQAAIVNASNNSLTCVR